MIAYEYKTSKAVMLKTAVYSYLPGHGPLREALEGLSLGQPDRQLLQANQQGQDCLQP